MKNRFWRAAVGLAAGMMLVLATACSAPDSGPSGDAAGGEEVNVGELERLGPGGMDYLVLGVNGKGFEDLSPSQRVLSYYLYRAAVAGNSLFTQQTHRYALEIQDLMEALYLNREQLTEQQTEAIHDYLKYLWVNHGQYDHDSHTKFVPNHLTPEMLREAADAVAAAGVKLTVGEEELRDKLDRLEPHIFDAEVEPLQVNQEKGADIVATSAVNLYAPGVTQDMLDRLPEQWTSRLNVRFDLQNGEVVPQPYRIGGLYGEELRSIVHFLEKAIEHAEGPEQKAGLRALVEHYRTGDEEKFREYSAHWLKSKNTVDYLNGFVESYKDPRGVIGQFEANVSYVADSSLIDALADQVLYFEDKMPWPDKYKREEIEKPVANVVRVVIEVGDSGPNSPAAYNLPNYADIRRDVGSKNIILSNIEEARSDEIQEILLGEFYLPHVQDVRRNHGAEARRWIVYMHEVIGHGSGQPEPNLSADPAVLIGRAYSSLEECRADLVALYHIFDPKLVEIGAFTAEEQPKIALAAYVRYLQSMMVSYRRIPGTEVREAHRRGRQLVLAYLSGGGESGQEDYGVSIIEQDGNYYVDVTDVEKARRGVGEILNKLQLIKSTGDAQAATDFFDRFGSHIDEDIHRNINERAKRLQIPKHTVFVFPRLIPVVENGDVVDAQLVSDEDLTEQQLRFSRLRFNTAIPAE